MVGEGWRAISRACACGRWGVRWYGVVWGGCHVLWNPRPETIRASIMEPTVVDMARRALPAADITSERRMTGRRPILSER